MFTFASPSNYSINYQYIIISGLFNTELSNIANYSNTVIVVFRQSVELEWDQSVSEACRPRVAHGQQIISTSYITFSSCLYFFCLSHSAYSSVWNPSTLKSINELEHVERHFTGRVPSLRHLSYSERLVILDLEPLEVRRLRFELLVYCKLFSSLVTVVKADHFKILIILHYSQVLVVPKLVKHIYPSNKISNNCFRYIELCNSLPHPTHASSLISFKT